MSICLQEQLLFDSLVPDATKIEIETFDFECSLESSNQILSSIMNAYDDDDMRSDLDKLGFSESKLRSELETVSYDDLKFLLPPSSTIDFPKTSASKRILLLRAFKNILSKRGKKYVVRQEEKIHPWLRQFSDEKRANDFIAKEKTFPPSKSVSFSYVEVREYSLTLGDHPDCSDGPPISLDWSYTNQKRVNLDYYEDHRGPHKMLPEMKSETSERRDFLQREAGFSVAEIQMSEKEVERIRKQRRVTRTLSTRPARELEEKFASAKRKMVRFACGKKDVCIALEQGRLVRHV
uniref:Uncharacterized protein n=1 Tax=Ditylum brightwellii TaxID=49249 RepID=A0A7S4T6P9_9STRA|mmetsp:Transcript_6911/g.9161  ORF Transcript_6911/g.9161 Transcript_6911/m.9161 type:complete len:293 (+) Transcript_6911:144-1022(+)